MLCTKELTKKAITTVGYTIFARWETLAQEAHERMLGFVLIAQDLATFIAVIVGGITIYSFLSSKIKQWRPKK